MTQKHTPGPWCIDDDGFIADGNGDEYKTIADCDCSDLDIDEREANKALIAAAPDLLDACELAARELNGFVTVEESEALRNLYNVIAKAKGVL